jgi:hypothetical protein
MDEFSYLSVLLSVILGLAVAQILTGFRGILLSRARIRIYWPVIAWAILILLACFQSWWAMFRMRARHDWTFPQFGIVLLQTIVTYMLAGLVLPDLFGESVVDLKENFYAHRRWFFAFGFVAVAVSVIKEVILDGRLPLPANLAFTSCLPSGFLSARLPDVRGIIKRSSFVDSRCSSSTSSFYSRACSKAEVSASRE